MSRISNLARTSNSASFLSSSRRLMSQVASQEQEHHDVDSFQQQQQQQEQPAAELIENEKYAQFCETLERAQGLFKNHPDAYHNVDLNEVTFEPTTFGTRADGTTPVRPVLLYKGEQSNLSHMTPFLPVFFSQLGPYGNAGKL